MKSYPQPRPATLEEAVHELRHGNAAFGARQLRVLGTEEAGDALREALSDPNPEIRGVAALQLSLTRRPGNANALGERLARETNRGARSMLIHALGTSQAPEAAGWLLPILDSEGPKEVNAACSALGCLESPDVIEPLRRLLQSDQPAMRVAAFKALMWQGCREPWMLEELDRLALMSEKLESFLTPSERQAVDDWERRWRLELTLGNDWYQAPEYLREQLDQASRELKDANWRVRSKALSRLNNLQGPEVEQLLVTALDDPVSHVRASAALGLGPVPSAAAHERLFVVARTDAELRVRKMAVVSLSRTPDSRLAEFLEDADEFIRTMAVQGLGATGDPAMIPWLQKRLDDPDGGVRSAVCHELFQLGAINARLVATLEELLTDPKGQEHEFLILEARRDAEVMPELAEEEGWSRPTLQELLASAREGLDAAGDGEHPE